MGDTDYYPLVRHLLRLEAGYFSLVRIPEWESTRLAMEMTGADFAATCHPESDGGVWRRETDSDARQ